MILVLMALSNTSNHWQGCKIRIKFHEMTVKLSDSAEKPQFQHLTSFYKVTSVIAKFRITLSGYNIYTPQKIEKFLCRFDHVTLSVREKPSLNISKSNFRKIAT